MSPRASGRGGGARESITREALVLRTVPYGDSDLVVHLLVRGLGRVSAFARGARRAHRRFAGGLEPFGALEAELRERRDGALWELVSARASVGHAGLRRDLGAMAQAGYATDLVRELARELVPHDTLLDLLLAFYALLDGGAVSSLRLRAVELSVLAAVGLAPELERCVRCAADGPERFDPAAGGAICRACGSPAAALLPEPVRRLMRVLLLGGLAAAAAAEQTGAVLPVAELRRLLLPFLDRQLGHLPKARAFLEQVGAPS